MDMGKLMAGISGKPGRHYPGGDKIRNRTNRHSCEGKHPENSGPNRLDARLRMHDE